MKQDKTESVEDFLTRLFKKETINNDPDNILLSVAMNCLRSETRTFVVTQNPNSIEQLKKMLFELKKKFN